MNGPVIEQRNNGYGIAESFSFISSMVTFSQLRDLKHAVPAEAAVGSGNEESKWVSEALLIEVTARKPLRIDEPEKGH